LTNFLTLRSRFLPPKVPPRTRPGCRCWIWCPRRSYPRFAPRPGYKKIQLHDIHETHNGRWQI